MRVVKDDVVTEVARSRSQRHRELFRHSECAPVRPGSARRGSRADIDFGDNGHWSLPQGKVLDEDSQIVIPPSFIALFVPAGRIKPTASREHIAVRYEFCEDLANLLTDQAKAVQFDLGIAESDVLERVFRGLAAQDSGVDRTEAQWVVRRLAELLYWTCAEGLFIDTTT